MHGTRGQYLRRELVLALEEGESASVALDLSTAATLEDDPSGFHLILSRNIENINRQNKKGWSALMYACHSGNVEAVKLLLRHGVDERSRNSEGQTAFMLASALGHEDILQLLSAKQPGIDSIDSRGWTSLMYATAFGHVETAKYLAQKGADVNFVDKRTGQSVLMVAASDSKLCNVLLQFLIGRGADHTLLSHQMKTAADIASELGKEYQPIADYLRNPFQNQPSDVQPESLQDLLISIDLEKYIPLFEEKRIDLKQFMTLTEVDLKNIGIRLLGPRKRMACAIEDLVHEEARSRSCKKPGEADPTPKWKNGTFNR